MSQDYRPSRFQILPPVVKNLLIINGIMFLATTVLGEKFGFDLTKYFGLFFPLSDHFNAYQLVTHLFMHGSFMHILLNMFALYMFGSVLENTWGSKRFFTYYLITGLGAALIHLLFTWYEVDKMRQAVELYASAPGSSDFYAFIERYKAFLYHQQLDYFNTILTELRTDPGNQAAQTQSVEAVYQLLTNKINVPTVGASGAVFGLLLAFGMLFPNTVLYLYFAIPIKAKYAVTIFGLIELYSGFANSPTDNVAHFAHLGGMLFGFILVRIWTKYDRRNFY